MRLITRITLQNLLIALVIFLIGGLLTYEIFNMQVRKETDYDLRTSLRHIEAYLAQGIPYEQLLREKLSIRPVAPDSSRLDQLVFSDTLAPHLRPDRMEWQRKLRVVRAIGEKWYELEQYSVIIEADDVVSTVTKSLLWLFSLLVVTLTAVNYGFFRWLLRPFQRMLGVIQAFDLRKSEPTELPTSRIQEFAELGERLGGLMTYVRQEYRAQKEFSENASHEIQTPLAIARGKLDLLVQSPRLNEEDLALVGATYDAVNKLSRLGSALTLLTKIENREFVPAEQVELRALIARNLEGLAEPLALKQLRLSQDMPQARTVLGHPGLLDILLSNLLKNAVRHNFEGGGLSISLTEAQLVIANTGDPLPFPADQIFERFKRDRRQNKSLGLGLAIARRIAQLHGFDLRYAYAGGQHQLILVF